MTFSCRHCGSLLSESVLDLGHQPPSNAYLTADQLSKSELSYPLEVYLCTNCWLLQVPAYAQADQLFTADYAYLSSTSSSWCSHAKAFVTDATTQFSLSADSFVIELASNDGYLLQYFDQLNIPCLGFEPTHIAAEIAISKGIKTIESFFGYQTSQPYESSADLVVANNVLAHVPDINDFMRGISNLLKPTGVASVEFQHLLTLLQKNQFDTIYHEHYSYLTLHFVCRLANCFGLSVFDVEKIPTHGGSLRVWICKNTSYHELLPAVEQVLSEELAAQLQAVKPFIDFQARAKSVKYSLLNFLLKSNQSSKLVVGYGAAAKGNTLLNYAGVDRDLLPFVIDKALSKQGKFLPGSHIPIISPNDIDTLPIDSMLVLPWNLIDEIRQEYPQRTLVTPIPSIKVYDPLI